MTAIYRKLGTREAERTLATEPDEPLESPGDHARPARNDLYTVDSLN